MITFFEFFRDLIWGGLSREYIGDNWKKGYSLLFIGDQTKGQPGGEPPAAGPKAILNFSGWHEHIHGYPEWAKSFCIITIGNICKTCKVILGRDQVILGRGLSFVSEVFFPVFDELFPVFVLVSLAFVVVRPLFVPVRPVVVVVRKGCFELAG